MSALEIGLVYESNLKINQSFLRFNVKKKYMKKFSKRTFSMLLEMLNTRHC